MMGKEFQNDVRITELESPTRLSFISNDGKTDFLQEFTFQPMNGGTSLERRVTFEMNPLMKLMFKAVIGPLVATPLDEQIPEGAEGEAGAVRLLTGVPFEIFGLLCRDAFSNGQTAG